MSDRRSFLRGLTTLPLIGGTVLEPALSAAATPAPAGSVDPFPGYHREIVALFNSMTGATEEADNRMMDRWAEIDRLAKLNRPTTLAGATACIEYVRREYVQFKMHDDEVSDDPGDQLILSLLDGALGVLRQTVAPGGQHV